MDDESVAEKNVDTASDAATAAMVPDKEKTNKKTSKKKKTMSCRKPRKEKPEMWWKLEGM